MNSLRLACIAVLLAGLTAAAPTNAQVMSQPTPAPLVTAEAERWYLNGDPITYSGNVYYPVGAQVHFNANEMVRSGFHLGVPLYTRTTIEPWSLIFVPLAGGRMQPYERRRVGDIAGTAGSTPPALPTAASTADAVVNTPQAAGPPVRTGGASELRPVGTAGTSANPLETKPIATAGTKAPIAPPTHTRIGPRPTGVNAVFLDYRERRWYAEGQAVRFDRTTMIQIGEHQGFPVFADRAAPESRIYIPVAAGGTMVAPYSLRRPQ